MPYGKRNQPEAGIGNPRHARVGDQSHTRPSLQFEDQFGRARHFIVLVIADGAGGNTVMVEKFLTLPRVLTCDQVAFLQYSQRSQCDVFQVPDRRADEVQRGHAQHYTKRVVTTLD